MSSTTVSELLAGSSALLVDCRNAVFPFMKDVFVYSKKYVKVTDFVATDATVVFDLDGVTEIQTIQMTKKGADGIFYNLVPYSITYTTTAGSKKVVVIYTVNTTTNADELHLFIVAKV